MVFLFWVLRSYWVSRELLSLRDYRVNGIAGFTGLKDLCCCWIPGGYLRGLFGLKGFVEYQGMFTGSC